MVHLTKPKTLKPIFTVVSCIFKYQNETLIVRRRLDKSQGGKWGMPSGKLSKGESLVQSMVREIKEEVGIEISTQDLKYFKKFYVDSSGKQFLYHLFILKLKVKPEIQLNTNEHTEYKWIKIKDIFDYDLVEDHPFCMKYFIKTYYTNRHLAVSFNIVLEEEISKEIQNIQKQLTANFTEKRYYQTTPHLAVCTKFIKSKDIPKYLRVIKNNITLFKGFNLKFTNFIKSETNNYIFLDIDEHSKDLILKLNCDIKRITKGIGYETPNNKPALYPFTPHISIIKIDENQIDKAMNLLKYNNLNNPMIVKSFEITVEERDENDFANFPRVLLLNT